MGINNWLIKKVEKSRLRADTKIDLDLNTVKVSDQAPEPQDYNYLLENLNHDQDYLKLKADEKNKFFEDIKALERTKPVITPKGEEIVAKYRLIIMKEIVKTNFFRKNQILHSLRSVIIYPDTFFLCQNSDSVGLANKEFAEDSFSSIKNIIKYLKTYSEILPHNKLLDSMSLPSKKEIRQLCGKFEALRHSIDKETSIDKTLKDFEFKWLSMKAELINSMENIMKKYSKPGASMIDLVAFNKMVPDSLKDYILIQKNLNKIDIHISWQYHSLSSKTHDAINILIHEIAHVIDFEHLGFDGVPSPSDPDSISYELWDKMWREQFEKAQNGQMKFLRPYALTNRLEFFAVTSEYFFLRHDLVLKNAPELYELLKSTYGFVPEVKKLNKFKMYLNIFSVMKSIVDDQELIIKKAA